LVHFVKTVNSHLKNANELKDELNEKKFRLKKEIDHPFVVSSRETNLKTSPSG
jgi:hypothetical protein